MGSCGCKENVNENGREVTVDKKGEAVDIDLNDKELADAALKIQSRFRGHKARAQVKGGNTEAEFS